jgi:trimethylamine--corrinoid protein Co-methyltransferase
MIEDFKLKGGLNREQIEIMHEKALYLIEKVGIRIPHDGVIKLISSYDGVKIEKDMVKFRSDLVLKALKEARYDLPSYAKNNWIISAGAHQTALYDWDTGKLREPTTADLVDLIKLGDALDTVGSAPVVPMDVPVHLQHILMHKVAYEHSRYRCNDIFEHMDKPTHECAQYVYEMAQVAGKMFTFGIWMISPKSFDRNGLDVAYRLRDKGIPMWVASMPMAGVSAPITMLGTVLQSIYEHLAGLTMLNLINPGSNNYISPNDAFDADAFDMKFSTFVYGSVEYVKHTLYQIPLCKYYNVPVVAKSLLTSSKEPDAHAAAEIGMHTLIAALAGARAFRCGGLLSTGEIYCAEQLIIVHEIVEYIKNLLRREEFTEDRLMVDEISAVGPGESFIGRKSTFENFKKEYWEPELFIHSNLGQWREMGSKSLRQCARGLVKKKIKEHTYTIDPKIKNELDRIYERAKEDRKLEGSFKFRR